MAEFFTKSGFAPQPIDLGSRIERESPLLQAYMNNKTQRQIANQQAGLAQTRMEQESQMANQDAEMQQRKIDLTQNIANQNSQDREQQLQLTRDEVKQNRDLKHLELSQEFQKREEQAQRTGHMKDLLDNGLEAEYMRELRAQDPEAAAKVMKVQGDIIKQQSDMSLDRVKAQGEYLEKIMPGVLKAKDKQAAMENQRPAMEALGFNVPDEITPEFIAGAQIQVASKNKKTLSFEASKGRSHITTVMRNLIPLDKMIKSMGALDATGGLHEVNLLKTEKGQLYSNMRRSVAAAIGRLHSGAAINKEEMKNFYAMVPSWDDSPASRKQKMNELMSAMSQVNKDIMAGTRSYTVQDDEKPEGYTVGKQAGVNLETLPGNEAPSTGSGYVTSEADYSNF